MPARKKVDYERIEPGWRAGALSPSQLAAEYTDATGVSVSRSAIIKHFTELGIPRAPLPLSREGRRDGCRSDGDREGVNCHHKARY